MHARPTHGTTDRDARASGTWPPPGWPSLLLAAGVTVGIGAASAGPSAPGIVPGRWPSPPTTPSTARAAGFEASAPGTVLASRPVTVTGLGLPVPVDSQQFLARSSDAKDAPTAVVGTLMVPRSPYPAGPRPLVSYQPATDSLGDQCNPSYKLRAGTEGELMLMMQALQQGWAVVVTDYEGPQNAFAAGRMAGHAVLDGIRAAEALPGTGLTGAGTPVGLWGYSGGGLATSWAAELQAGYAPELNVAAVASGGTPADLAAAARQIDGGIASGLTLLASVGISRAYPEMLSLLNDAGHEMARRIGDMCIGEAVSALPLPPAERVHPLAGPVVGAGGEDGDGAQPPRPPDAQGAGLPLPLDPRRADPLPQCPAAAEGLVHRRRHGHSPRRCPERAQQPGRHRRPAGRRLHGLPLRRRRRSDQLSLTGRSQISRSGTASPRSSRSRGRRCVRGGGRRRSYRRGRSLAGNGGAGGAPSPSPLRGVTVCACAPVAM